MSDSKAASFRNCYERVGIFGEINSKNSCGISAVELAHQPWPVVAALCARSPIGSESVFGCAHILWRCVAQTGRSGSDTACRWAVIIAITKTTGF